MMMNRAEKHFYTSFVLSVLVHVVVLTAVFIKPVHEPREEFKELKIKLGVQKPHKVAQRQSVAHKPRQARVQQRRAAKKTFPQKVEKSQEKEAVKIVSVVSDEKKAEEKQAKPLEQEKTALIDKPEPKVKSEDLSQAEQKEVVKVMEKASSDVVAVEEGPVMQTPPVPVTKMANKKIAYKGVGDSVDEDAEEISKYEQAFPKWINQFRVYPEQARVLGLEGTAIVRLLIKRDGKILKKKIMQSTGHPILDKALMQMIKNADPVIPFPPGYHPDKKALVYDVEFSYSKDEDVGG